MKMLTSCRPSVTTEDRGVNTFTSVSTFNTICAYTDSNNIKI